jgi:hypothetical protein
MLRTWSATGNIVISGGRIDASASAAWPEPAGGGGAGGSIVLLSRTVTLSNATLTADGVPCDSEGDSGKIVIACTYLNTNSPTTLEAKGGSTIFTLGGPGGGGGPGGAGGLGGLGGPEGEGGKGGTGGGGLINPYQAFGGLGGKLGAGGAGGAGGAPGTCIPMGCCDYYLITIDSDWWYWDVGYYPGDGWQQPDYYDPFWKIGRCEFGYGDNREVTHIISTNLFQTTYFRQHFLATNSYYITNLTAMLRRDDGIVLYLNGVEVFRDNMPDGTIYPETPALAVAPDDGTRVLLAPIAPYWLREGTNVLAAEIHQRTNGGGGDMTFDLRLLANAKMPYYTQVFPPGYTVFTPQLINGSNGVSLDQLLPNVPVFTQVFIPTPSGTNAYIYDGVDWYDNINGNPSNPVLLPGNGLMLYNPESLFQVQISGLPPYPPRTLQLQRNVPALVGRQLPARATFKDIVGFSPQNGTKVTRGVPGYGQTDYTFINSAWQPAEPIAQLGEAVWITLPCLYVGGPSNFVVEAVSPQGAPMPRINTNSYCGGSLTLNCSPPLGSMLPLGTTVVTCQATDGLGSSNTWTFTVRVADTTAPTIQAPTNIIAEATGPLGATVFFTTNASDLADPSPYLICSPPSGTLFPLGTTWVRCTAWDHSGNTNQAEFPVTVRDTLAPQIICPANVTLVKTRPEGAQLRYALSVSDVCDTNVAVEYSIPSGAIFGVGTTTVTCKAIDASGNRSTCSFDVHVISADPGRIAGLVPAPNSVVLAIPTQEGVQYQIQYKDSLDDPIWQPLAFPTSSGSLMIFTDTEPSPTARFYRVVAP